MNRKVFSFLLAICIMSMCSIPVSATTVSSGYGEKIYTYDGIKYSKEVTLEQMENLSPAFRDVLRDGDGIIVCVQDDSHKPSGITPLAVYPSSEVSGTLVVRRTSNYKNVEFLLTVTRKPTIGAGNCEDKMALSWAGGGALISDSCAIQTRYQGPYENVRTIRAEVSPNQGVSYHLKPTHIEQNFLLRATVSNSSSGSQYKNVVGGYARKTYGLTGLSTSFGAGTISFGASFGTSWDEMSPVYTRFT